MHTVTLPTKLLGDTVDFIEASSVLNKRAMDEVATHRQAAEKAAAIRSQVLDGLIEVGLVPASQKQAAEAMLGSHAETLTLMSRMTEKFATLKQAAAKSPIEPGRAEVPDQLSVKSAGYNSLTTPHVGRPVDGVKESDKPLLRLIRQ